MGNPFEYLKFPSLINRYSSPDSDTMWQRQPTTISMSFAASPSEPKASDEPAPQP